MVWTLHKIIFFGWDYVPSASWVICGLCQHWALERAYACELMSLVRLSMHCELGH